MYGYSGVMNGDWQRDARTPAEAVALVTSGMRVFVHGAAATPTPLLEALSAREDIADVTLYHMHTSGPAPFAEPEMAGRLRSVSLFTGSALRTPIEDGRADFLPVFLSDIPYLFTSGRIRLDAALIQVSPPDRHGLFTLGTSIDSARAAADTARVLIAEINAQMPRTRGNVVVPFRRFDAYIATDRPLHEHPHRPESEVEAQIGSLIADLVEDGSTLQMGIGGIPDAVVCADSIGHPIFSGIGGQLDFIRGAALSEGGKPIIALPSTAARGAAPTLCRCARSACSCHSFSPRPVACRSMRSLRPTPRRSIARTG